MPDISLQNNQNNYLNNQTLEESKKNSRATDRGTRIIKNRSELDKNAFLRILTAELSNQNPFDVKDSTQYVSQMAQFASMEQMTNLNSTMTSFSAYSLVGKTLAFNRYDMYGRQYGGVVQNVVKKGDSVMLQVNVQEKGKVVTKDFDIKEISNVINAPDEMLNLNNNMNFLLSSSFIGKNVEVVQPDGLYVGKVKSVYKDSGYINLTIDINGKYVKDQMKLKEGFSKKHPSVFGPYNSEKDSLLQVKYDKKQGKYNYKIDEEPWKEYKKDEEIKGIKIGLPNENPDYDTIWNYSLKGVPKVEKDVNSLDVLLIKNS